ncbi:MAG TPA: hypothetical protein VGN17_01590 [Bryobacteraceae bacterium]|jgi:hypothetical protein
MLFRKRQSAAAILLFSSLSLHAQWMRYPSAGTPRLANGKPDLTAATPKLDGHPDLSGIWKIARPNTIPEGTASYASLQYWTKEGIDIQMQPWAKALFEKRYGSFGVGRPSEHCLPHSIPDAMLVSNFKIKQDAGLTLFLYEEFMRFRQIFTDGRPFPKDPAPAWFGYSTGKWEGDSFVVETMGYNDLSWLDDAGHPHSEAMVTTERFQRRDFGHMEMELTVNDPKAYLKPWSVTMQFVLMPDTELIEDLCDNERDGTHMVGK